MPKLEEATINIYEYPYPLTSEVHIPEGMFQNCKSLKKFTSNGTSKVYQYAFMACTALETLSTPDIDEIEQYAFAYCTNLKFTIYGTLLKVGDYAFAYCQNIKINTYNFTDAGKYIFIGSQAISTLDINRSLGEYEFYSCQQLTSIKLHENINTIPRYCFANCTKLTSTNHPNTYSNEIVVPQPGSENENLYQVASYAINITFYIPGGLRLDDFSWIKYFGNIDVKIDETNPYYYTKDHAIINKQTNTLLATFGNIGKKYSIPKEVEYMDANSIFTSQFTHYIDADSTLFENDKYQGTILKIPDTVKVVNSQKTNPYYDTVYCYKGRYYQNSFILKLDRLIG